MINHKCIGIAGDFGRVARLAEPEWRWGNCDSVSGGTLWIEIHI